jgi:hypothetical protein
VIVLVLVAGVVVAVAVTGDSGPTATVDQCRIEADGTLTASGGVAGGDTDRVRLGITFADAGSGKTVDRTSASADLTGGSGRWEATGSTSDEEVRQVTCTVARVDPG